MIPTQRSRRWPNHRFKQTLIGLDDRRSPSAYYSQLYGSIPMPLPQRDSLANSVLTAGWSRPERLHSRYGLFRSARRILRPFTPTLRPHTRSDAGARASVSLSRPPTGRAAGRRSSTACTVRERRGWIRSSRRSRRAPRSQVRRRSPLESS